MCRRSSSRRVRCASSAAGLGGQWRVEPQILAAEDAPTAEQQGAFQDVAQLPDIARPWIGLQGLLCVGREPDLAASQIGGKPPEQMLGEQRDILDPLPQRGDDEGDGADPKVEVAAEFLLLDEQAEVLVGGGDQADVDPPVADVPQPAEALLL